MAEIAAVLQVLALVKLIYKEANLSGVLKKAVSETDNDLDDLLYRILNSVLTDEADDKD